MATYYGPVPIDWDNVDLPLLAYDLADQIERCEHPIDPASDEILAELPAFLAALRRRAENRPPDDIEEMTP